VVDDPSPCGSVAGHGLRGHQAGTLKLLEHRIEPFGLDLPGRPQAAAEAVGQVIAVAGTLEQQTKQGTL
jgi:hypothetical protein